MQETQETRLQSLDQEDPVEKGMTVFLPGEMKVEGAYYYQCGYKTWLPTWLSQTPPVVGEGLGYLMTVWPEVTNHILVAHSVKNPANVGHLGSIPGLGRSPGKGNGNLLQSSCLESPLYREAWRAQSMGSQELDTT